MTIFYRPADGFVGDVIPFYWEGLFHAFYLKAALPPARVGAEGTPFAHLVSRDLAHWEEWPDAVRPGAPGEPDAAGCWTGSVVEREGVFHLFYTGHAGPNIPQTICHATSRDLHTWEKDRRNPILRADPRWYDPMDWRDPFPFWNEEAGEYWMLLAARVKDGPPNRRGCTALAASPDLERWEVRPPLWTPRLYFTHECPDLFRWGDRWAFVFSEFSDRMQTRYCLGESPAGPWVAPADDAFDGRAFYAAKTASDGRRRFAFGWNPTREGETDAGKWEWGGAMVVHELKPRADGGMAAGALPEVEALFVRPHPLSFQPLYGEWDARGASSFTARRAESAAERSLPSGKPSSAQPPLGIVKASLWDGLAACLLGDMPDPCLIRATLACGPGTRAAGLLLRTQPDLDGYYQIRWEPDRRRVVFDHSQRRGGEPVMVERPVESAQPPFGTPPGGSVELVVFVEGSVIVAYIDGGVALSCRGYDQRGGQLGLFVVQGEAAFSDVSVATVE
jgi:beta-fructofuranosidase